MTKIEFLNDLKKSISHLPEAEIEKSITFYSEMIDDRMEDGICEEAAVNDLGNIENIVQEIELDMPITTLMKNKIRTSREKSQNKTLWIVLTILGTPFWLPLAIAFALLILSVYITIWAMIFSLYCILFSLAVVAIGGIVLGIVRCITTNIFGGFMMIGMTLMCIGLFILFLRPILWMTRKLAKLTVLVARKTKNLFISRKEVA